MRTLSVPFTIVLAAIFAAAGCDKRPEEVRDPPAITAAKYDLIVLIMLDTSGSYAEKLRTKGHPFCMHVIDTMFVNRLGANDRLILGQISGTDDPLFWAGEPGQLRKDYATPKEFYSRLMNRSDPGGSRVFDSMADGLEHLLRQAGVRDRKCKVCAIFLTDMDESFPEPEKSKARLLKAMTEFGKADSCMGIYWCDPRFEGEWQLNLDKCIKNNVISTKFDSTPKTPNFE